eukprot:gene10606-3124_t
MANNFEIWYRSIPIITRTYLTLCTITAFAVTFDLLNPFQLYLNFKLVFQNYQLWSSASTFSLVFIFCKFINHDIKCIRYFYCRRLEEHSFHGKSADFFYMLLFGCVTMLISSCLLGLGLPFLSNSLVMMVLYIWSRRNPHERLRLYGMFTVGAGYLAYILLGLSMAMGGNPFVDILGIAVGHVYYFFSDLIPLEFNVNLLKTPFFITMLFPNESQNQDENIEFVHQDEE